MSRPFGRGSVTALLAHSALIQTIVFLVRPSITYQAIALDVPIFALGALAATFALVPLALAVPAGGWVDRFGERLLMLVGSATVILATVVLLLAGTTLAGLIAGTALLGAGHLGCIVGQQTVVANTSHGSRLDTMFGYYTFSASLGQAIGPLLIPLAGGAVVNPNTTILFAVGAALSLVLLITTFGIARVPRQPAPASAAPKDSALAILKVPGVARAITTSAVIVAAVDLTLVYIPALGAERGLTAATVGIVLAIRAVFSMISRLFLGRVSARIGRGRLITAEHRALRDHSGRTRNPAPAVGTLHRRGAARSRSRRRPATDHVVAHRADAARSAGQGTVVTLGRQSTRPGRNPCGRRCCRSWTRRGRSSRHYRRAARNHPAPSPRGQVGRRRSVNCPHTHARGRRIVPRSKSGESALGGANSECCPFQSPSVGRPDRRGSLGGHLARK